MVLICDYTNTIMSKLIVIAARSLSNDTTVDALHYVAKLGQSMWGGGIFCYHSHVRLNYRIIC